MNTLATSPWLTVLLTGTLAIVWLAVLAVWVTHEHRL